MTFLTRRALPAFVAVCMTAGTALADDLALVVGNRNYDHAARLYDAEKALNSVRPLERLGFTVISARDMSRREARQAMRELAARSGDADKLVILLNGYFVHSSRDTWFLPVDTDTPSVGTVGFNAISLDDVMEIASAHPGGAVVLLGTFDRPFDIGAGLSAGIGAIDAPQGVMVATARPEDTDKWLRESLLEEGTSLAQAAVDAPDSVTISGFLSPHVALLDAPVRAGPPPEEVADDAWFDMARALGTADAYKAYLDRYPRGAHASAAQRAIGDLEDAPRRQAEAAEKALGLNRDARRKVQEALSLLGYDTRGIDGVFGRGTRGAISAWQTANRFEGTGYLTARQIDRINRQAQRRSAELEAQAQERQRQLEEKDQAYWDRTGADGSERGLRRYLKRYPDGLYADIARAQLGDIEEQNRGNADRQERNAWDDATQTNTVEAYQAFLDAYPGGRFSDEARARIDALEADASNAAEVEAARAEEEGLRMNVLARVLVEKRLNALGLRAGVEDGFFDEQTRAAIRRFQQARDLPVTGYVTRQTAVQMLN